MLQTAELLLSGIILGMVARAYNPGTQVEAGAPPVGGQPGLHRFHG